MNNGDDHRRALWLPVLFYASLILAAIVLPILLWRSSWPIIQNSYGKQNELKELLGFSGSLGLLIVAAIELGKRRKKSLKVLAPIVLWLIVSFHCLMQVCEYSVREHDYLWHEQANELFRNGAHPYDEDSIYSYPPLPAVAMSWLYRAIQFAGGDDFRPAEDSAADQNTLHLIYYFYLCGQFLLVNLIYWLCYLFARRNGLNAIAASLLVACLLLLSNPLLRTLKHNQLNLWMLALIMLGILLHRRCPMLCGLSVALGGHIKLYPLILILPLGLTKRWRAMTAAIAFATAIALGLSWLQDWHLWQHYCQYLVSHFLHTEPLIGSQMFRNNCIPSIVQNTLRFSGIERLLAPQQFQLLASMLHASILLALAVWFASRFIRREKIFNAGAATLDDANHRLWEEVYRMNGHFMDAVVFTLLAMPMVWEHHYVLAMPVVIWAAALLGKRHPWPIALAAAFIFAIPTFEVFPFSYHRFAALSYLTLLASPKKLANFRPR